MATATVNLDALDLFDQGATTKKKASDHPTFSRPDLEEVAQQFSKHRTLAKSHEDQAAMAADELKDRAARKLHLDHCERSGKPETCIYLECGSVTVKYVVPKKYSPIPAKYEPALKATFGPDFDRYFLKLRQVELKKEAQSNPQLIATLLEKLGPELFNLAFDRETVLAVTDAGHNALLCDPATRAIAEDLLATKVIKPTSPSISLA